MPRSKTEKKDARTRLLETADRLFYAEGIHSVGIDRIIAEAGVAKMTLYSHFASKDALIAAVLEHRGEQVDAFFTTAIERHVKKGKDRLRAFFATLEEWFQSPEFRGCAFQNAAVELADPEHEGTAVAREQKRCFGKMLLEVLRDVAGDAAPKLMPKIALIVEGAVVSAVIQGSAEPARLARDVALELVENARSR